MAADTLTVKLKFANKLRRIRVEQPVDKLKIFYVLRDSNYPEYKNMLPSNLDLFELAYSDEEGDTVALTDSIDFKEAFAFFANANKIPCFSVQIKNEAGSYIHHEAFAEEDLTPASHSPPSNDSVEGFGDRPPLPSGMSLLGSSGSYSAFPSGSAFSSPGLGVPSLGGLLAPQSSGINFGNLLPPAGSASDANGLGSSSDLAGSNLSSLSLAFDGHSADPTFQRDNSAESLSAAPFSSSTLYGGSGSQLSTSAPSYSGAFNSNAPAFTSSGTKLFNSQGFGSQGPFFGQNQVDPQQRNAQPFIPGTSLSDESEKSSRPRSLDKGRATVSSDSKPYFPSSQSRQPKTPPSTRQRASQEVTGAPASQASKNTTPPSAKRSTTTPTPPKKTPVKSAPTTSTSKSVTPGAVSWKAIAASATKSGGGRKITHATKAPAAGQSLPKKTVSHLGDGQLSSFLSPVYPDTLFSEKDNLKAIHLHQKQGLNPAIVKHLFKGAATDDRRQERQNGAHAALGDGKNAKLILLGRDGDSATGKFWMLKSDGNNIYLVDPRENYHVLVKSPRGGYVRVRHEPFEYRYNFEFVPHPKIKANTKSGRYFVKYRRNDNIRQYFCEIRKNNDDDDAALVFRVKRTHQTAFAV